MTQPKIKLNDLRRIIREELTTVNEAVDHAGIRDVVTGASKLLAAVEAFKTSAPVSVVHAVTPHIDILEKVLEDMVSTPGSYVPKKKLEPKKVSLKAVKSEGRVNEIFGWGAKKFRVPVNPHSTDPTATLSNPAIKKKLIAQSKFIPDPHQSKMKVLDVDVHGILVSLETKAEGDLNPIVVKYVEDVVSKVFGAAAGSSRSVGADVGPPHSVK